MQRRWVRDVTTKTELTFRAELFIAGDVDTARAIIRQHFYERGLSVTVTVMPTSFIYAGGDEAGMVIGLVNHPSFPLENVDVIRLMAREVAELLMPKLNQRTSLIVTPELTEWIVVEPPGATQEKS